MRGTRLRRCRLAIGTLSCVLGAGCLERDPIPDQTPFAPLASLEINEETFVRLYAAPILGLENIAIHPWFVVKWADETKSHRWEVCRKAADPYGHVRKDLTEPKRLVDAGGAYVLAQLIGPAAECVVAFIETESPNYSCRHCYAYFPGPNSNTYAQWILDNTGWNVNLPAAAIGKHVAPHCENRVPHACPTASDVAIEKESPYPHTGRTRYGDSHADVLGP